MKKLIYSLSLVLLGLVSCTTFDDPTKETYAAAPSVNVTITPGAQTDSAFTIVITPDESALYYAYAIGASSAPEALDSATLYKGGYGNTVIKRADQPTTALSISEADPNTTYYVYAVAGSDKGMIGSITVKSITTTDNQSPSAKTITKDADNASVSLGFSEDITRGEGAVTAQYYKEWDILNPVDIAADDITVSVEDNEATFAAANVPAGAYVCFSYAAGAFKDAKGNNCGALTSGLNMSTGDFRGAWVRATTKPFDISMSNVTSPELKSLFGDWKSFKAELTFTDNVYRNDEELTTGAVSAYYENEVSRTVYKMTADQWSIDGNKIYLTLPAEPNAGDMVSFIFAENTIFDVYGNGNNEFSMTVGWTYFVPQKENVLGTFSVTYTYNGEKYKLDPITIEEAPTEDYPTNVVIKNFYLEGSELTGYYDLAKGKLYIDDGQVIGKYTSSKGTVYGLVFYNYDNETADAVPVPFSINANGTLTADAQWGAFAYDEAFENQLGWLDLGQTTTLTKTSAARKMAASKKASRSLKSVSQALKARLVKRLNK